MYKIKDISVVIPSYNNLEYLKLAYSSIRNASKEVELILFDDGSDDGTKEWLNKLNDTNCIIQICSKREGHTILYDRGFNLSTKSIIGILHADMVIHKNFFKNIIKHINNNKVICGTCVEPPLHPPGKEKYTFDAGMYPNEYNDVLLNKFYKENAKNEIIESIFAPWFLIKEEYFNKIGGHDVIYAPYGYEDSDLFSRMALAGFEFIQSRDAFVYHFTQRGHKWNKGIGIENNDYQHQMNKTQREYIRKFGTCPKFDLNHKPTPLKKYNIGFVINNCNQQILEVLEPWCNNIYVNCETEFYINKEQPNTKFNLKDRIKNIKDKSNNILIEFDATKLTNSNFQIIQQLPEIIQESGEIGEFELDIFKVTIKNLETYEHTLIKL